eukprot:COSAG01_NODE_63349_length_280_cov_0.856354_1_plen_33_part_01
MCVFVCVLCIVWRTWVAAPHDGTDTGVGLRLGQ